MEMFEGRWQQLPPNPLADGLTNIDYQGDIANPLYFTIVYWSLFPFVLTGSGEVDLSFPNPGHSKV